MDHRFSKHEYFISCSITLFLVGVLAASYFDISVCPYSYSDSPTAIGVGSAVARADCYGAGGQGSYSCDSSPPNEAMKSLLSAVRQNNGLSCHMIDIVIWVYIVGLVVFMGHKFITYRVQGMHYFFLDYCYFHSATLLFFLLWRLVDVEWSEKPLISWGAYLPSFLSSHESAGAVNASAAAAPAAGGNSGGAAAAFQHPLLTAGGKGRRFIAAKAVASAAKDTASSFPDGLYYPISLDILTTSYVTNNLTANEVLSSFVIFFTLLAGSLGPILGAILMWRNALLFHSFDRMSSCYLHLMPATIQGMLLHRLFTAARREIMSISPVELFDRAHQLAAHFHEPLENFIPKAAAAALSLTSDAVDRKTGQPLTQQQRFARYAKKHPLEAFCGEGTMCYDLGRNVTYSGLLKLHIYMFLVWEVFYNVFSEVRRHQREHKLRQKQLKKLAQEREEFMRLTGATEEEADLLRPPVSLSEGLLGNPAERVTAYTWMMEHPPGGKKGLPYRFVTCLGMGRFPTTVLFQVTQLILHCIFFTWCYPVLYLSFHVFFSAVPILLYVVAFVLITVYNAACMDKKWIGKLQRMANTGMEAERIRQSFVDPAAAGVAATRAPTAEPDTKKSQ